MRAEFQQDLDQLEADLQEEGIIVLRSLRGVLNALESQDVELADEVIAFDDEVDDRYHGLEKQIVCDLTIDTYLHPRYLEMRAESSDFPSIARDSMLMT